MCAEKSLGFLCQGSPGRIAEAEVGINLGVLELSAQRVLWRGGWSQGLGGAGAPHIGHMLEERLRLKWVWTSVGPGPSIPMCLARTAEAGLGASWIVLWLSTLSATWQDS